jgi:hypothetical protein
VSCDTNLLFLRVLNTEIAVMVKRRNPHMGRSKDTCDHETDLYDSDHYFTGKTKLTEESTESTCLSEEDIEDVDIKLHTAVETVKLSGYFGFLHH